MKPLGKKRRRKALTTAERKLKKAKAALEGNTEGDDESEEEEEELEQSEEPEELETLEVPDSQVDESMEVVESLPKPTKKHKGNH